MSSGAYIALSGLQTRAIQLDRLASDIANVGTSGYKAERSTTEAAARPSFGAVLQSAIDVTEGGRMVDFRGGTIAPTGGDLDIAIQGRGFFAIETPEGTRYTRNGHFTRRADGVLATEDGDAVLGDTGPLRLSSPGALSIDQDGQVRVGETPVGRARLVDFPSYDGLQREDGARFRRRPAWLPCPRPTRGRSPARSSSRTCRSSNASPN